MTPIIEQHKNSTDFENPKLLSICMFGRDDDYTQDFRYRITTTLNYISRSLAHLGQLDNVEILVTDWGSETPMAKTLHLSPESVQITRFIYVSPETLRATQNGKEDFHSSRAPNVAIRRASGEYVIFYNADTLIPQSALESLLRLLNKDIQLDIKLEQTFLLLPRFDVPWQFLMRSPSLDEWDRYLLLCSKSSALELQPYYAQCGGAGALLMHSSLWNDLRGLDETLSFWGWNDNDLGYRVSQNYSVLSLSCIGLILYHMGHPPTSRSIAGKIRNPHVFNIKSRVNDKNWGLGNIEINFQYPFSEPKSLQEKTEEGKNTTLKEDILLELTGTGLVQNIRKTVQSLVRIDRDINDEDLNILFLLGWYSFYHYPRKYIEFATGKTPAAAIVASGCPSVEIYKVDRWEGISPPCSPLDLSEIYEISPYCGYLRFINGDIRTAVERLRDSFIGPLSFDLCLIKEENLKEGILEYLGKLLPYLAPGGAVVFTCRPGTSLSAVRDTVQKEYPEYTVFICKDNRTGLILAVPLMAEGRRIPVVDGISFDTGWLSGVTIKGRTLRLLRKIMGSLDRRVFSRLES
jgi:hypothetical protein